MSFKNWLRKPEQLEGNKNGANNPVPGPLPAIAPTTAERGAAPSYTVFENAFDYTVGNEGGYSNVPEDRGGPTNHGVTQEELGRWRHHAVSAADVKALTLSEARAIYKAWYWDKLSLDKIIAKSVAIALFDRSVLNGLTGVSRHVRNIFDWHHDDAPNFDPLIGDVNAMNAKVFVNKLADFCEEAHRIRVKLDPTQQRFLAGWLNRCTRMRRELGQ